MSTTVKSLAELRKVLTSDLRRKEKQVRRAIERTAKRGADTIRKNVPVAFSELRDSVHVEGFKIVIDAPHAAAVNNGSRPHMPPIEPIIAWVKLRGMQGLAGSSAKRLPGSTTAGAASAMASAIASLGTGRLRGNRFQVTSTPVDAPTRIAWAIAISISKNGTKPHHFIEKSTPAIFADLDIQIARALHTET